MKKRERRSLKVAAWSGILVFVISLVLGILNQFLLFAQVNWGIVQSVSLLSSALLYTFSILFMYGFVVLGRKYNASLLTVMSWILIAMSIFMFVFILISSFLQIIPTVDAQESFNGALDAWLHQQYEVSLAEVLAFILILHVFVSVVFGIYYVLFGIGLLKIQKQVEHARTAGILNIVAGATLIIIIGWLVAFVAYIIEIILLFKASQKLER
ncbi:MAG: hypothetical protein AABX16_05095 [Nanoarchaeota archaeon]